MTFKSRTPAKLAADARAAYEQLTTHRPDGIDDGALHRHLTVLTARMNDDTASNTQLAALMDPPLSMHLFGARLRRAIEVAGVIREPVGLRTTAQLSADARAAHEQLTERRPDGMSDGVYQRYLTALAARMNNPHAGSAQLAAAMDPPVSTATFDTRFRRAIAASTQTRPRRVVRDPRTRAQLCADARAAHEQLMQRRPEGIGDDVYQRYLGVLAARINNPRSNSTQLAAAMDSPISKDKFNALFYRALRASVRKKQPPKPNKLRGIPGPHAARQATEAADTFAVLLAHRPGRLTDDRYVQLLTVLAVRMDNPTMTYRELGAQLDPPLTPGGFHAALRHAHNLAGVDHTFTPHSHRRTPNHQRNAAA